MLLYRNWKKGTELALPAVFGISASGWQTSALYWACCLASCSLLLQRHSRTTSTEGRVSWNSWAHLVARIGGKYVFIPSLFTCHNSSVFPIRCLAVLHSHKNVAFIPLGFLQLFFKPNEFAEVLDGNRHSEEQVKALLAMKWWGGKKKDVLFLALSS